MNAGGRRNVARWSVIFHLFETHNFFGNVYTTSIHFINFINQRIMVVGGKMVENEFKIKFDGQLYQVDAQTFITSLVNISAIIQEVNQELQTDKKIDIKIKAIEKGSFIAGLSLQEVAMASQGLFNSQDLAVAANIVTVLVGLYTLKKHLGGKKAKKVEEQGDKISIENDKGIIQIFDNRSYGIFTRNQVVNDAISNNFAVLEDDPSVSGFEILNPSDKVLFEAEREEFNALSIKSEAIEEDKKENIVVATVVVHKIVFDDRYKWEFYYNGNKISAYVTDADFFSRINLGEKFSKGDSLKVDLQINQIFDPSVNIYVNHSYQINKVHEHMPRAEQSKLNIDGDTP